MSTRKDFLAATSLAAFTPLAAQAATPAPKAKPTSGDLSFVFDQKRFNEILAKPAKHKQCFGAAQIASGGVLYGMDNTMNAYEQYLHEAPASTHTVAVLYHGPSIFLAMNDSAWNELLTPFFRNKEFQKSLPPDHKRDLADLSLGKGNPFLHSIATGDVSVESLVAKGSNFFVCHNALAGFGSGMARLLKLKPEDVHRQLLAALVPGALAVPAGVMAINACQEAKFTYIQSSL